jgi:hypothetical protein
VKESPDLSNRGSEYVTSHSGGNPRRSDVIPKHKSGKAQIATALPMGSREPLYPSDNRHCASSAKNSDENQVAATQRKAKTNTREQGKERSAPMSVAPYGHCLQIERG